MLSDLRLFVSVFLAAIFHCLLFWAANAGAVSNARSKVSDRNGTRLDQLQQIPAKGKISLSEAYKILNLESSADLSHEHIDMVYFTRILIGFLTF